MKEVKGIFLGFGCWVLGRFAFWLLVFGCWLLVVGCWLLVVGCWQITFSFNILQFYILNFASIVVGWSLFDFICCELLFDNRIAVMSNS